MSLTLEQIIKEANNLADDMLTDEEVRGFVNDAISAINIEVNADFPFLHEDEDIPVFPEKWQRMLIIPFVKARIKEKDSSQFEWEAGYEQFFANLAEFKTKYEVPEEYQDIESLGAVSKQSILNNVPYIWGGW